MTMFPDLPDLVVPVDFEVPTVQYNNGHTAIKRDGDQGFMTGVPGFYSQVGIHQEFDEAMHDAGYKKMLASHQREGKAPDVKQHWDLGRQIGAWWLCAGPTANTATRMAHPLFADKTADAGIALQWKNNVSQMWIRGYLYKLVKVDYIYPVQLTVSSRMTDRLVYALEDHVGVCEHATRLLDREALLLADLDDKPLVDPNAYLARFGKTGTTNRFRFYDLAFPLKADDQLIPFGKQQTSMVYPIVSAHPDTDALTTEYIAKLWRSPAVIDAFMRDWQPTATWAHTMRNPLAAANHLP